ncbi:MAG: hypothetical protein IPK03_01830 [Bacteroidetes bacterium]|nr:hypothetical protein [Bacteroidota bacterium]
MRNLSIICSVNTPENLWHESCNYILVTNPRQAFQKVLTAFFVKEIPTSFIAPNASIHASAKICASAFIGYNTVIEENCEIGEHVYIGHNNVICANTKIANHVKIGNNNTIGGVGFGYEKNESNAYELIPHIGNVVMEDYVEIGNNTCIDRAVLGSTRLKAHAKVDNLVHIAHGVVIGNNSLVIANAMVAGSTKVGDHVWIAPSASILNKVNIGNHVTIGMGAVCAQRCG